MAMKDYTDFVLKLKERITNKKLFEIIYTELNDRYNDVCFIDLKENSIEFKSNATSKNILYAIYLTDNTVRVVDNYNNRSYCFYKDEDKSEITIKKTNDLNIDTKYYRFKKNKLVEERSLVKANAYVNPPYNYTEFNAKHYDNDNVLVYHMRYTDDAYQDPFEEEFYFGKVNKVAIMANYNSGEISMDLTPTTKDTYVQMLTYNFNNKKKN